MIVEERLACFCSVELSKYLLVFVEGKNSGKQKKKKTKETDKTGFKIPFQPS